MMTLMKKAGLAGAITTALLLSTGAQAASDTAQINITATVVDSTCTLDTSKVPVDLGRAAGRDFAAAGDVGASATFKLHLSNCGADVTKVKVTASGTPDDDNSELFKNTGAATGVGVAVFGDANQSTQLKPDGNAVEYDITGQKEADLPFKAELRQSADTKPGTGDVVSVLTLTLTYE